MTQAGMEWCRKIEISVSVAFYRKHVKVNNDNNRAWEFIFGPIFVTMRLRKNYYLFRKKAMLL